MSEYAFTKTPVTPGASPEARALLAFLCDTAGRRIITGQHTQDIDPLEIRRIRSLTGEEPKLRGFELLGYSPNINYDDASFACLDEVRADQGTMGPAIRWGQEGLLPPDQIKTGSSLFDPATSGIVTLSCHWFSPLGGRDKSFYAVHTDFDPDRVLVDGSPEQAAFDSDAHHFARILKRFEAAHIPVLWRPFHESDGTWFWWGRKGPVTAGKLFKRLFRSYTEDEGLKNLLWVWNSSAGEGYPGDDCCDVISADIYLGKEEKAGDYGAYYQKLVTNVSKRKVPALAEVGKIPDLSVLSETHIPWAYFMTWSKEFILTGDHNSPEAVKRAYQSPYAIDL